jgi:hypothetical protein
VPSLPATSLADWSMSMESSSLVDIVRAHLVSRARSALVLSRAWGLSALA